MSVIIVARERVHQKNTSDVLTQRLVHESAVQSCREVLVVPAAVDALVSAVQSATAPTVISFARDAAFLEEMQSRYRLSTTSRFINTPTGALFATRYRFLSAIGAVASGTVPRWIGASAELAVSSSVAKGLTYPLWVHHPVYNSGSGVELGLRVRARDDLEELCSRLAGEHILLQENVAGDVQKVYFLNGRVVSDKRLSGKQEAAVAAIAVQSGSMFFGIDFVIDGKWAWILEMNDWPSFRGHESALAFAVEEVLA